MHLGATDRPSQSTTDGRSWTYSRVPPMTTTSAATSRRSGRGSLFKSNTIVSGPRSTMSHGTYVQPGGRYRSRRRLPAPSSRTREFGATSAASRRVLSSHSERRFSSLDHFSGSERRRSRRKANFALRAGMPSPLGRTWHLRRFARCVRARSAEDCRVRSRAGNRAFKMRSPALGRIHSCHVTQTPHARCHSSGNSSSDGGLSDRPRDELLPKPPPVGLPQPPAKIADQPPRRREPAHHNIGSRPATRPSFPHDAEWDHHQRGLHGRIVDGA
jgi:hypothetical protein